MTLIESVIQLPLREKLEIMEALWADLSKDPDQVAIPDWHMEILEERAALAADGKAVYLDFETVKQRLLQRR